MKILIGIAGGILVAAAGGLGYMGVFTPLKIGEQDMGPYPFVYVQSASTDAGDIARISRALAARLDQGGYTQRRPAQVFFPSERGIQHQVGFVTDRAVTRETLAAEDYFRPIPATRSMVAHVPFRNRWSFVVGAWRVDRAFREHRREKKYADTSVMVIVEGDRILYVQPIEPA